jgi:hypothetical protein
LLPVTGALDGQAPPTETARAEAPEKAMQNKATIQDLTLWLLTKPVRRPPKPRDIFIFTFCA